MSAFVTLSDYSRHSGSSWPGRLAATGSTRHQRLRIRMNIQPDDGQAKDQIRQLLELSERYGLRLEE